MELLRAGFPLQDLRAVATYLQREIRAGRRHVLLLIRISCARSALKQPEASLIAQSADPLTRRGPTRRKSLAQD